MKKENTVKAIAAITYIGCAVEMAFVAKYLVALKRFNTTAKEYNESIRRIKNRNK